MKPYQHHDPIADKGKAVPHPQQPTRNTRSWERGSNAATERALDPEKHTFRRESWRPVQPKGRGQGITIRRTVPRDVEIKRQQRAQKHRQGRA